MRVVIPTMIYGRFEVLDIWAAGIHRLIKSFPDIEFNVLIAGSEGEVSRDKAIDYGFDYIQLPNFPLGLKANLRLQAARDYEADYCLFLGSDNLISNATFGYLLDKAAKGYKQVSNYDLYLHDSRTKRTVYSKGYTNHRRGESLAVGRFLHKDILNALGWTLWSDSREKWLDVESYARIKSIPHRQHKYRIKDSGLFVIDIKTVNNISSFQMRSNWIPINFTTIKEHIPEAEAIYNL